MHRFVEEIITNFAGSSNIPSLLYPKIGVKYQSEYTNVKPIGDGGVF